MRDLNTSHCFVATLRSLFIAEGPIVQTLTGPTAQHGRQIAHHHGVFALSRNGFASLATGLLLLAAALHSQAADNVDPALGAALANAMWVATFSTSKLQRRRYS